MRSERFVPHAVKTLQSIVGTDPHERQEDVLRDSTLDWTAVRPVFLTNSKNDREVFVSEDNKPRPNLYVSRRNLAAFMLNVLEKNLYLCQAPVVSEK